MNRLTTALAATAIAFASLACAARADSLLEPRTTVVRFDDLDINTIRGAAALYGRLEYAAATVCRGLAPGRSLALVTRYKECVRAAIVGAVMQIDRPTVTDLAIARGVAPADAAVKIKLARNQRQ